MSPTRRRDTSPLIAPTPSGLAAPKKHSITIAGHRTSITLEDAFWRGLKTIAEETGQTVAAVVAAIDAARAPASLSAAIRVSVLLYFQKKTRE